MLTQTCSKCERTKPHSAFYKRADTQKGVHSQCKRCRQEVARTRAQELAAREHLVLPTTAVCGKCGERKEATSFHKSRSTLNGLCPHCVNCRSTPEAREASRLRSARRRAKARLTLGAEPK